MNFLPTFLLDFTQLFDPDPREHLNLDKIDLESVHENWVKMLKNVGKKIYYNSANLFLFGPLI
jgi:hypothetical protein